MRCLLEPSSFLNRAYTSAAIWLTSAFVGATYTKMSSSDVLSSLSIA